MTRQELRCINHLEVEWNPLAGGGIEHVGDGTTPDLDERSVS
jgi:hypothetical protein